MSYNPNSEVGCNILSKNFMHSMYLGEMASESHRDLTIKICE